MYTLLRWSSVITLPIAVGVGGIALVLLFVADTWAGRALGLGFFCASIVTALLPLALDPRVHPVLFTEEEASEIKQRRSHLRRRRVRVLSPLLFVAAICLAGAWVTAPNGVDRTTLAVEPGLQSIWIGPGAPNHLDLPWVTPERDQLVLATHLLWALDPFLDRQEAAVFRAAVRDVYDELGEAADRWPWRGIAWLSAVMFEDVAEDLAARLPVPTLVLHGGADDRIPMPFIHAAVDGLRAGGATVDLDVVEDADHFLLFTHRDRVDAALDRWLSAVDAARPR